MKIGMRKPSVKKSISARTTGKMKRAVKRSVDPTYGKKGIGIVKDPKKSVYNKVYDKTTVDIRDILSNSGDDDFSEYCDNLEPVQEIKISKGNVKAYKFVVLPIGIFLFLLSLALKDYFFTFLGLVFIIIPTIVIKIGKKNNN